MTHFGWQWNYANVMTLVNISFENRNILFDICSKRTSKKRKAPATKPTKSAKKVRLEAKKQQRRETRSARRRRREEAGPMVDSGADSRGALSSAEETELGDPTESDVPTAGPSCPRQREAADETAKMCAGDKVRYY